MPPGLPPYAATALHGFQSRGTPARPSRPRHAITAGLLVRLKAGLIAAVPGAWDQRCIWAAVTLAFFGALRVSEYLGTGPDRGLRRHDLCITPYNCSVRLIIQKNHQFGPATWVSAPATGNAICPVRSLGAYCAARDQRHATDRPLFILHGGSPLTPSHLNRVLRTVLGEGYSSHSLRIGLATAAAESGVDDVTIQRLGRWRSGAFNGYVRARRPDVDRALLTIARTCPRTGTGLTDTPADERRDCGGNAPLPTCTTPAHPYSRGRPSHSAARRPQHVTSRQLSHSLPIPGDDRPLPPRPPRLLVTPTNDPPRDPQACAASRRPAP